MNRRMRAGLGPAMACAIAFAAAAWAQAGQEGGAAPEAVGPGPTMETMEPGTGPGGPPMSGRGPMPGMRGAGPRVWERLGLSDAQRRRLEELRNAEERKTIRLETDLRIAELDLRVLVAGERPDLRAIGEQVDHIADLRGEMMKAHLATDLGMRQVLTPGQRARLGEGRAGVLPREGTSGRRPEKATPARRQPGRGR